MKSISFLFLLVCLVVSANTAPSGSFSEGFQRGAEVKQKQEEIEIQRLKQQQDMEVLELEKERLELENEKLELENEKLRHELEMLKSSNK